MRPGAATSLPDFYRGLAGLLRAGVVEGQALESLRDNGTLKGSFGEDVVQAVAGGETLSKALARYPNVVPGEDVAIIEAGEATGRLDMGLDRIALLHDERRQAVRTLLTGIWYPIFIAHLAVLLLPVAFLGLRGKLSTGAWLWAVLSILLPAYGVVWLVSRLRRRSAVWRERVRGVVEALPGFGAAAVHRRRANFAALLEAAYDAGIRMDRALELAGRAAHEPAAARAAADVARGDKLSDALGRTAIFSSTALSQLATGEDSGELSRTLHVVAAEEGAQADTIFRRSIVTLGNVVALLVTIAIGYFVLTFYLEYFGRFL